MPALFATLAESEIDRQLTDMVAGLDAAIERAVQDPLSFSPSVPDSHSSDPLAALNSACFQLLKLSAQDKTPLSADRENLIWQVRARAGRLQMLLDSAARFYNSCFSFFEPAEADYGFDGAWSESPYSGHLFIDC